MRRCHGWTWIACAALLLGASPARANGRFPATTGVTLHEQDSGTRLIATTFGLLITRDDGATHHWVCEDAIGYGGTFDPHYAMATDGAIYATTVDGLRVTRDGGCTWQLVGAPIDGGFATAVELAPDGTVWATVNGAGSNGVFSSRDGGTTFSSVLEQTGAWWQAIAVGPVGSRRVFVSGYVRAGVDPDAGLRPGPALLFRSDDDGASWQPLPVDDFQFADEPALFVEAVSPVDEQVVFARVRRATPPNGDAVYRSVDGGQSWTKVLDTRDAITALVVRADGRTLVVGTKFDGVRVSPDRGQTWSSPAAQPQMGCIAERYDGVLFACGANWEPDMMALGRSVDAEQWSTVFAFATITGPLACAPGTVQLDVCTLEQWPSLAEQLGVGRDGDAGPPADAGAGGVDAGTGGRSSGCGCSAAALVVPLAARRRRRPTARP